MLEIYEEHYLDNCSEFRGTGDIYVYSSISEFTCPISRISKRLSVSVSDIIVGFSDNSKIYFTVFPEFRSLRLFKDSLPEYLRGLEEDLCRAIIESPVLLEYKEILGCIIKELSWEYNPSIDPSCTNKFCIGTLQSLHLKETPGPWETPLYELTVLLESGEVIDAESYLIGRSSNNVVVRVEKHQSHHLPLIKLLYEFKGYGIEGIDSKH